MCTYNTSVSEIIPKQVTLFKTNDSIVGLQLSQGSNVLSYGRVGNADLKKETIEIPNNEVLVSFGTPVDVDNYLTSLVPSTNNILCVQKMQSDFDKIMQAEIAQQGKEERI